MQRPTRTDAPGAMVRCAQRDCTAEFPNHQWGHIKANGEGWFEQRDGTTWCPTHSPSWVGAWRENRIAAEARLGRWL